MKKICILIGLILFYSPVLWAWDVEFGVQRSKPQIAYRSQTYQSGSTKLTFVPNGESTIFGQSAVLGLGFDDWLFEIEQARYGTTTMFLDSQGNSVTLNPKFQEDRYGFFYRQERELAGFFAGAGVEKYLEEFSHSGELYQSAGQSPYAKVGLVLIFGAFRVRADQIHSNIGEHILKTSSIGMMLHF